MGSKHARKALPLSLEACAGRGALRRLRLAGRSRFRRRAAGRGRPLYRRTRARRNGLPLLPARGGYRDRRTDRPGRLAGGGRHRGEPAANWARPAPTGGAERSPGTAFRNAGGEWHACAVGARARALRQGEHNAARERRWRRRASACLRGATGSFGHALSAAGARNRAAPRLAGRNTVAGPPRETALADGLRPDDGPDPQASKDPAAPHRRRPGARGSSTGPGRCGRTPSRCHRSRRPRSSTRRSACGGAAPRSTTSAGRSRAPLPN